MKDWAEKKATDAVCGVCLKQYDMGDNGDVVHTQNVVKLLHAEFRRTLRILARLSKQEQMNMYNLTNTQREVYLKAIEDVRAAVEKGRV